MTGDSGVRLLALRCDALAEATTTAISDLVGYFEADLIYIVEEKLDMRIVSTIERTASCPVVYTRRSAVHTEKIEGTTVSIIRSLDYIGGASTASGQSIPNDADYVICDEIQTNTDSVTMDASLEGLEHLARYQHHAAQDTTYLTGTMEASYDFVWYANVDGESVRLSVRGLAPNRRQGEPELACFSLGPDGHIAVSTTPANKFGLRALSGVGGETAQNLAQNGYKTRDDVIAATERELQKIRGIGESKAQSIRQSAHALSKGCVIRLTNEAVPAAEYTPLFIDIETDSLNPSIIWLIGVYNPESDEYVDFIDKEPSRDNPGKATREFIAWLASEHDRPSLIAWNGHDFDFKYLSRFIRGHAPEYTDYWTDSVFEYDLLDWAVRKGNAILPGRTNQIEDVAEALGHGRDASAASVDGGSLAKTVQRLLASPERARDVDWESARAYCEADVRELAAVYESIAEAAPGHKRASILADENTTQTGLMDF
ncbi:ribonuclease H-like domain-containing protein [Natrarchaeobaculum sulfurireducens]|uniref:Helix-hairpin-helix motif protein n=1 Tax=Natrarchaeobaculum sulfurireducens TaxID=2044521 RepID=A0A346P9D3_9EURY|nr:ribonuclease H-like domain-containing protein [Natrarchaeobaculum sulfurireducens]AXR76128.1 helix-hairpin-helix motif protein [Natrarchaeobaculum sulfurireducens]